METTLAIPVTLAERLQLGPGEHRIAGSYEDFVARNRSVATSRLNDVPERSRRAKAGR